MSGAVYSVHRLCCGEGDLTVEAPFHCKAPHTANPYTAKTPTVF